MTLSNDPRRRPNPLAGALAGLVAGLAAAYLMEAAQRLLPSPDTGDDEPATVVTADTISKATTGETIPRAHRALAGNVLHYALGGALGAAYGGVAEYSPIVTAGLGAPFGLAVAAVLDEALVRRPRASPARPGPMALRRTCIRPRRMSCSASAPS